MLDRIAPRFARYEPLRHAGALMLGLVSDLDRKNCWTIAERRGHATPDRLAASACRGRSGTPTGCAMICASTSSTPSATPDAVLVVDETGDVKKGVAPVGVQRQYTGTAGRIENAQVAVYLTYAAPRGHALIDRALYLPRSLGRGSPSGCAEAESPTTSGVRDQAGAGHRR